MVVAFDSLPDTSRIWIYQSNREFNGQEEKLIEDTLKEFCDQWTAHGAPIKSAVKIFYNRFIVLAADESFQAASGCSIDSTLRLFHMLEAKMGCSLLDRMFIAVQENESIKTYSQVELKELFANGILTRSTLAFNNVLATKGELKDKWLVPVEKSWIKRLLPKVVVAS